MTLTSVDDLELHISISQHSIEGVSDAGQFGRESVYDYLRQDWAEKFLSLILNERDQTTSSDKPNDGL